MTNNLPKPERQQSSVAIQGIDTSTPDTTVADGKCKTLHNMHFSAGAWRPAYPFTVKHTIPNHVAANYLVVYHHPAAGDSVYILQDKGGPRFYSCDLADDSPSPIEIATFEAKQDISHFGNVLIFSSENTNTYFLLDHDKYSKVVWPPYARLSISSLNASAPNPSSFSAEFNVDGRIIIETYDWSLAKEQEVLTSNGKIFEYDTRIHKMGGESYLPAGDTANSWRGEMLMFTTWQTKEGVNINPSPLLLINSALPVVIPNGQKYRISNIYDAQNGETSRDGVLTAVQTRGTWSGTFSPYTRQLSAIFPKMQIRIPKNLDYSSIEKLVIWATRVHPTFETVMPSVPNEEAALKERFYYADNDLANQPFYKYMELDVSEFKPIVDDPETNEDESIDLVYEFSVSRASVDGIINNTRYEPDNNIHTLIGNPMDYNNRLHIYNSKQILADGYNVSDSDDSEFGEDSPCYQLAELLIDGRRYYVASSSRKRSAKLREGTPRYNIISYPDFRAQRYSVEHHFSVPLSPAIGNNFAWYKEPYTQLSKFPPIVVDDRIERDLWPEENRVVYGSNKLRVSASNNPFSFPFANSYSIGTSCNVILALQSAAIEMSDAKFGEFPLYAFTTEGVFALQAGNETLYASIIPINYDHIINPRTLAINGAIVYITEEGVKMLTAQGATLISTPLNDSRNLPDREFLEQCTPIWDKVHDELLLQTVERDEAYVYNLGLGYWSTRALHGVKLNTDELWSNTHIIDLRDEDAQSDILPYRITTRPIKLGTVEFKRIETFIPRLHVMNPLSLTITLEGSNDPASGWHTLRTFNDEIDSGFPLTFRRTPFSCKYLRFIIDGVATGSDGGSFALTNIDFEWYLRHAHRMR